MQPSLIGHPPPVPRRGCRRHVVCPLLVLQGYITLKFVITKPCCRQYNLHTTPSPLQGLCQVKQQRWQGDSGVKCLVQI
ncbi:hypothetical protein CUMW_080940 [Citrus unshiu]|nr:hypothetical protein CUMW_080940 [Citrus unshiu]